MCSNTIGSFFCSCDVGYRLNGNGLYCTGEQSHRSIKFIGQQKQCISVYPHTRKLIHISLLQWCCVDNRIYNSIFLPVGYHFTPWSQAQCFIHSRNFDFTGDTNHNCGLSFYTLESGITVVSLEIPIVTDTHVNKRFCLASATSVIVSFT